MIKSVDKLRGHPIKRVGDEFFYIDTGEPTARNRRVCGHCGLHDTPEGHDGCLGTLPDVMNACCGHGGSCEAYIQYWDGSRVSGKEAIERMSK